MTRALEPLSNTAVSGAFLGLSHMNADAVITFAGEGEVKVIAHQVVG